MQEKLYKVSAGGVIIHNGKVLTIIWRSHDSIGLPKGTVDEGESLEFTALREVKEETGYDGTIVDDLGSISYEFDEVDGNHYTKTVTFYLMALANDDPPVTNLQEGEDFENNWLTIEQAFTDLTHKESKEVLLRATKSPKFAAMLQ